MLNDKNSLFKGICKDLSQKLPGDFYEVRRALEIAVGITVLALLLVGGAGAATLTVDDSGGANYSRIQDAINNASAGDTILVNSGTYYENVNVTKQLVLRGVDNGGGKPVVDANKSGSAITLSAGNSTIEGFTVINASRGWLMDDAGIRVISDNNIIENNTASNDYYGIMLISSNNTTLKNNIADSNQMYGILLIFSSNNNTLIGNNASNDISGIYLVYSSNHNTLNGNTANTNNQNGIFLGESSNNTLRDNKASNNSYGIQLTSSNNTTLSGNSVTNNIIGIALGASSSNTIYNNYFNNTNNAQDDGNNIWNTTKTPGTSIIGGSYIGGNFWANPSGTGFSQTCADNNGDEICDSPYALEINNIDYLPLAYNNTPTPPGGGGVGGGGSDGGVGGGVFPVEIRGTVFQDPASIPRWDANNFAGFYYDLKYNRFTELLNFIQPLGTYASSRSLDRNQLEYTTTKVFVQFKANEKEGVNVSGAGVTAYQLVGWQAEKWIAVKGMTNKIAKLAFEMGTEDKKTLTIGETWSLGAGYEMIINAIDARTTPRQVWFTLTKDGVIIDEVIVQAPQSGSVTDKNKAVYYKTKTILGESDSLLFTVYVDTIFSGATSDMVQFKYAWLIDESSAKIINSADQFGVFEVREANANYIRLTNENSVNLSSNTETTLIGNMKFRIADNSSVLRFYPFVEHTMPGVYEIRGRVAMDTTLTPSWDAQTFAGFYYDIDDDVGSERLTLESPLNNRNIPDKNIIYSTSPQEVSFTYSPFGKYQVIGFMADKYFAGYTLNTNPPVTRPTTDFSGINGLANGALHKVLIDDDTKRTISVGGTIALKEGYVLKATDIDLNARVMLLSLLKDGAEVDITPLGAGETYVYAKTVGGTESLPLIMVRFDNVFSGQELQVAFLKGIFQLSETTTTVKTGNQYGKMEVTTVSKDSITMSNNGSIGLDKNTEPILLGNIKLKIADDDYLRFYPKIDYVISDVTTVKRGDVNPIIGLDVGDVLFTAQFVAGVRNPTAAQITACDVNTIPGVDVGDVLFVAQGVAGLRILV
jgi:S-layer protein (TIGR01567 family)